jgi:TatA/E family protein of Tat protein translocase
MGSLGMPEILVILVIALIIFGPRKLPELGKTLGQSLAQFRRASEDFKRQWEDEVVMERQRIEAVAPAPVEHSSYATAGAATEEPKTISPEEPSPASVAAEANASAQAVARHDEPAAKETKRDWM